MATRVWHLWNTVVSLLLLGCLTGCPTSCVSPTGEPNGAPGGGARDTTEGGSADAQQPAEPLAVVVVDDPAWAVSLQREWSADSALPLAVTALSATELQQQLQKGGTDILSSDVILFPAGCFGELAERNVIEPMPRYVASQPDLADQIIAPDTFALLRGRATRWGGQTYAATFGGAPWMLLYRRDLFEALQLPSPQTWEDVGQALQRMEDALPQWRDSGMVDDRFRLWLDPSGDGLAAQMLLCRAASYARHPSHYSTLFDYQTLTPLIDGPPFVRALQEAQVAWRRGGGAYDVVDERQVESRFLQGQVAMAIWRPRRFPSEVADPSDWPTALAAGQIGVLPLPGSRESYSLGDARWETHPQGVVRRSAYLGPDDRLGAVVARSRRRRVGWVFLGRLATSERSLALLRDSALSLPFRHVHLEHPQAWIGNWREAWVEPVAAAVASAYEAPEALIGPRLPRAIDYLAALDDRVRAALSGQQEAEAALAQVREAWSQVTDQAGQDAQRSGYLRSLGLQP